MTELTRAGQMVMDWLKANEKSQRWLASKLGVGADALWRWCVGKRTPRIEHCVAIERVTGVPASAWAPAVPGDATPATDPAAA